MTKGSPLILANLL